MAGFANYAESELIKWLLSNQSITRPTAWYIQLHTGDPGEAGSSNLVTGNAFARQAFLATAESVGEVKNDGAITFPQASGGNWGLISHVSVWDHISAGNCLMKGALNSSKQIDDGDQLVFNDEELTFKAD